MYSVVPGGGRQGFGYGKAGGFPWKRPGGAVQPGKGHEAAKIPAEHAYDLKKRRLIDHRLRTPHRKHIQDKLYKSIAHWVDIPIDQAPFLSQHVKFDLKCGDDETVLLPADDEAPTGNVVNARLLLFTGVEQEKPQRHIMRRVQILGGNKTGQESKNIMLYGGLVLKGTDAQIIQQMCTLVKNQCGLDLSFIDSWYKFFELQYSDTGPTIFLVPNLWDLPAEEKFKLLKLIPQVSEEKSEVEEKYEEEEVDEDATVAALVAAMQRKEARQKEREEKKKKEQEEAAKKAKDSGAPAPPQKKEDEEEEEEEVVPKVMKKVEKTRKVEKITKTKTIIPVRFSLANLVDFQVQKATDADSIELCCAADALDEFMKREMATRMHEAIKEKHEEALAVKREEQRKQEMEESLKRKKETEDEQVKKVRKVQIDDLRQQWAKEDSAGLTDEDKRTEMKKRQEILKEKREGYEKEDKQRAAKAKAERIEALGTSKPPVKTEQVCDQGLLDAFSYFDRLPGFTRVQGTLPRLKIENLLQALDQELTVDMVSELLNIPQIPKVGGSLPYKQLAMVKRELPGEEVKEEKVEEVKEEAVEETKPAADDEMADPAPVKADELE